VVFHNLNLLQKQLHPSYLMSMSAYLLHEQFGWLRLFYFILLMRPRAVASYLHGAAAFL
jgi:hypothetical protein